MSTTMSFHASDQHRRKNSVNQEVDAFVHFKNALVFIAIA